MTSNIYAWKGDDYIGLELQKSRKLNVLNVFGCLHVKQIESELDNIALWYGMGAVCRKTEIKFPTTQNDSFNVKNNKTNNLASKFNVLIAQI